MFWLFVLPEFLTLLKKCYLFICIYPPSLTHTHTQSQSSPAWYSCVKTVLLFIHLTWVWVSEQLLTQPGSCLMHGEKNERNRNMENPLRDINHGVPAATFQCLTHTHTHTRAHTQPVPTSVSCTEAALLPSPAALLFQL